MTKIEECIAFLEQEHPQSNFMFNFPKSTNQLSRWHLYVSDFDTYYSEDFKVSLEAIRSKFPTFKFVCVCLKNMSTVKGIVK